MRMVNHNLAQELRRAKCLWKHLSRPSIEALKHLVTEYDLSVATGDVALIQGSWYVTHSGLLRLAERRRCHGIHTKLLLKSCDPANSRWVFRATVFKSRLCKGFTGYGDADPSNISLFVQGAAMRVAETRAVNRALRKAYGLGICSVEEIGSSETQDSERTFRKLPPESSNGNNSQVGNGNGTRVRDRLCQIIRQHKLDAELVKSYAIDFCGTQTLRVASREQVENFVAHLADWAAKDRNALLCRLNSYVREKAGAA